MFDFGDLGIPEDEEKKRKKKTINPLAPSTSGGGVDPAIGLKRGSGGSGFSTMGGSTDTPVTTRKTTNPLAGLSGQSGSNPSTNLLDRLKPKKKTPINPGLGEVKTPNLSKTPDLTRSLTKQNPVRLDATRTQTQALTPPPQPRPEPKTTLEAIERGWENMEPEFVADISKARTTQEAVDMTLDQLATFNEAKAQRRAIANHATATGNDHLVGGSGDDQLAGGAERDRLQGRVNPSEFTETKVDGQRVIYHKGRVQARLDPERGWIDNQNKPIPIPGREAGDVIEHLQAPDQPRGKGSGVKRPEPPDQGDPARETADGKLWDAISFQQEDGQPTIYYKGKVAARQDPEKGWVDDQGSPVPIDDPDARKIMRSFYEKEWGEKVREDVIDAALTAASIGASAYGLGAAGLAARVAKGIGWGSDIASAVRKKDPYQVAPSAIAEYPGRKSKVIAFLGSILNGFR